VGIVLLNKFDASFSYAHDDNVASDDAVPQFRLLLKKKFEAEMRRRFPIGQGAQAEIFMDRHGLPSNGDLSQELEKAIQASLFLFIFIGDSYPRSDWCGQELKFFMQNFDGNRVKTLERTFLVVLERSAIGQKWNPALDEPNRPIFQEFFDDATGKVIPFILEGPDGQAYPSPRVTRRLRGIVETMADRASDLLNRNL
jgi:hypothetical protein